jgi:hypothetical protein
MPFVGGEVGLQLMQLAQSAPVNELVEKEQHERAWEHAVPSAQVHNDHHLF